MNQNDHAVVVGISRYGALRPELEGPERDATAFASWLTSPTGGDVPPDNVKKILSSGFPNQGTDPYQYEPTLSRVTSEFARLMGMTIKNASRPGARVGRRLYIYLSGHGLTPEIDPMTSMNQSALAMANCVEDSQFYEYVPGLAYANWFHQSHSFEEILLFMDCCRDDRPEVKMISPISTKIVEGGRPKDVRTFYAFATQWDSRAWEMPLGNPAVTRGVFTYALLEALTEGTPDAQGRLTPRSIVGHLAIRVPQLRNGDSSQRPQFMPPIPDDGIVLVPKPKKPQPANLEVTFDAALIGKEAILQTGDGSFTEIKKVTITAEPWPIALPPGAFVIAVSGKDFPVSLRPGEIKKEHIRG